MGIKEGEKSWPSCVALFRAFQIPIVPGQCGCLKKQSTGGRLEMEKVEEQGQGSFNRKLMADQRKESSYQVCMKNYSKYDCGEVEAKTPSGVSQFS